MIIRL